MAMKERTGRNRVSKADQISRKIESDDVLSASSRASTRVRPSSKADQIARKIDTPAARPASVRVRPDSKADQIARKIDTPAARPASVRVRPDSKADQIARKIPVQEDHTPVRPSNPIPSQPSARIIPPVSNPKPNPAKSMGCCMLPFVIGVAGIIGALVIIF